jgi:hypothetical protein
MRFLFGSSYDSQGYGEGIGLRLHTGLTENQLKFKVRVTLRLTVYSQSVRLGVKPLQTHDQRFFLQQNCCDNSLYVISSLTRR